MLPDRIDYREREAGGQVILTASFYHGEDWVEQDVAVWSAFWMRWEYLLGAGWCRNYKLAVDQLNALAGPMESLCYNCHGLKRVRVPWRNTKLGRQGWTTKKCPCCKGLGVRAQDRQLSLVR